MKEQYSWFYRLHIVPRILVATVGFLLLPAALVVALAYTLGPLAFWLVGSWPSSFGSAAYTEVAALAGGIFGGFMLLLGGVFLIPREL